MLLTTTQIIQLSYVLFLSTFGAFLRDLYLSSNPKTKEDEKLNLKRIFASGVTIGIICFTFQEYFPLAGMAFFGMVFLLGFASHYIVGLISNGRFLLKVLSTTKGEIIKEINKQIDEENKGENK